MKKLRKLSLVLCFMSLAGSAHAQASMPSALKGTWKSNCMSVGSGVFILVTASFDGVGLSEDKILFYKDAACSQATGMVKSNSQVKYSLGPKLGDENGMEVFPIDITVGATQLTQDGKIILSRGAQPTQYDIVAVKGNNLYMSSLNRAEAGPILSPAKRPSALDLKNFYTRQ